MDRTFVPAEPGGVSSESSHDVPSCAGTDTQPQLRAETSAIEAQRVEKEHRQSPIVSQPRVVDWNRVTDRVAELLIALAARKDNGTGEPSSK